MARTKIPLSLRVEAEVKDAAESRAAELHRTVTAYVEWLILEDAKRAGIAPRTKATTKRGEG